MREIMPQNVCAVDRKFPFVKRDTRNNNSVDNGSFVSSRQPCSGNFRANTDSIEIRNFIKVPDGTDTVTFSFLRARIVNKFNYADTDAKLRAGV